MNVAERKNRGFTLIELLVVMAVIALLMSILLPSLKKAREQSRQTVCATNLHAIGQGFFVYAHDNDDRIVPGDYGITWAVWALSRRCTAEVNLGYLMKSDALPVPDSEESVFFCPSMKPVVTEQTAGQRYFDYETFQENWQTPAGLAPVDYMYNTSLDGFGNHVGTGKWAILSHTNRVQYLLADGSVHTFKVVPLTYNTSAGQEILQDACQRTGCNFPAALLHEWFAEGQIDLNEATAYLADPAAWMNAHADSAIEETAQPTRLAQVAHASLVSDVVGAWESPTGGTPPPPG